jgi:hypothetical protein
MRTRPSIKMLKRLLQALTGADDEFAVPRAPLGPPDISAECLRELAAIETVQDPRLEAVRELVPWAGVTQQPNGRSQGDFTVLIARDPAIVIARREGVSLSSPPSCPAGEGDCPTGEHCGRRTPALRWRYGNDRRGSGGSAPRASPPAAPSAPHVVDHSNSWEFLSWSSRSDGSAGVPASGRSGDADPSRVACSSKQAAPERARTVRGPTRHERLRAMPTGTATQTLRQ